MEEKKGFFKKVWTSIKDFDKYEELAAEGVSRAIIYMVTLTAIFAVVIAFVYTYEYYTSIENIRTYIEEDIDEISVVDGVLDVETEDTILWEDETSVIPIVIVDTSEEANEEEYIEKAELYDTGLILLSDKAIIVSSLTTENQEISYSSIFTEDIETKDEFLELITASNLGYSYGVFALTIFVYMFIVYLSTHLIDAFVLGVLGYLFARIVKLRLKFAATFNIGVYALTLPIVLNMIYILINAFTGFTIEYFSWMYTTISYIYVVVAILMIKTEIINQKIELMRLEKIQEQVKEEELEETDENKEEKQEDKEEEKTKENEDEKKQTGTDSTPEGSNA